MQTETAETIKTIFEPALGREIPVARRWEGVPKWITTHFIVVDGAGNWGRGRTLTDAKGVVLKAAGAKSHAHFNRVGMLAYMIRQDERSPEPWVNGYGMICNYADQFNGDYSLIEEIKCKRK